MEDTQRDVGTMDILALLEAGFKITSSGYCQQIINSDSKAVLPPELHTVTSREGSSLLGQSIPQDPSPSPEVLTSGSAKGIVVPGTAPQGRSWNSR